MRKIYISCHHNGPANALADMLTDAMHTVSSTWHRDDDRRPGKDDASGWGKNAKRNMMEIANSDVLVVIASSGHIDGTDRVPGGKFVEAGYALGRCVMVITLGGVENGMMYHPNVYHAADVPDLLNKLA